MKNEPETPKNVFRNRLLALLDADILPSDAEARNLVDNYYQFQEFRKALANQHKALVQAGEGHVIITALEKIAQEYETGIKTLLDRWTNNNELGRWAKSIPGIGPVISAGLLAHIDITKAPTVGKIWRFAGLDPTQNWLGAAGAKKAVAEILPTCDNKLQRAIPLLAKRIGTRPETLLKLATSTPKRKKIRLTRDSLTRACAKRPWNARLKTLCWHIGECFVKVSGNPADIYGQVYLDRKPYEEQRNAANELADQAKAKLARCNIGKGTEARKHYEAGRLPPGHIHSRAKRVAVKLFLAHYHEVAYRLEYGTDPPNPYPMEVLGHAHYISPPGDSHAQRENQTSGASHLR